MNAITAKQAKQNMSRLIKRVITDAEPTIICTDSGDRAVLLSLGEFNSWRETHYLLSNPANAEHLRRSLALARRGEKKARKLIE